MSNYVLQVRTLSPLLLGSGEGQGSTIDRDIVFDNHGLPYFPARRLKGLMRESCTEVCEMASMSHLSSVASLPSVSSVFGTPGQCESSQIQWPDLHLESETELLTWLGWLRNNEEFCQLIQPEAIVESLTERRTQTRINENGVAAPGTLRISRLLRAGVTLSGVLTTSEEDIAVRHMLALGALNLRHAGLGRNRGWGKIQTRLLSIAGTELTQSALDWLRGGAA